MIKNKAHLPNLSPNKNPKAEAAGPPQSPKV